jgi:Protein of unknown function (DUF3106)
MNSGNRKSARGGKRRPGSGLALAFALSLAFLISPASYARGQHVQARPPAVRPAPMRPAPPAARPNQNGKQNGQGRPAANRPYQPAPYQPGPYRPAPGAGMRPGVNGSVRPPGHLQDWMARHQNLPPAQQENLLRSEPGFNRLSPDQQARVMNRFHTLESRPAAQRERITGRVEAFEHLSPADKQDVRASAATMAAMRPDRQALARRAFNDLRQVPPGQRQQILNSARFSQEFSPQERHVIGSLLSIEPYQAGNY